MKKPTQPAPATPNHETLVRRRALQIYIAINKGDAAMLAQVAKCVRHYLNLNLDALVGQTIGRPATNEFARMVDTCINELAERDVKKAERDAI